MTQFLRDQGSDSEEVVTPLMLDGTYLSRNFATLGPSSLTAACLETGISFKGVPINLYDCVPLSSHEIDGVRKEK